jgi:hypothetical protein
MRGRLHTCTHEHSYSCLFDALQLSIHYALALRCELLRPDREEACNEKNTYLGQSVVTHTTLAANDRATHR